MRLEWYIFELQGGVFPRTFCPATAPTETLENNSLSLRQ
jgi:hypothetical protein